MKKKIVYRKEVDNDDTSRHPPGYTQNLNDTVNLQLELEGGIECG